MRSPIDLKRFAEHVVYEIEMLLATDVLLLHSEFGRRLSGRFHPTLHNALLQSHTIHVRNLYAFFYEKRRWREDAIAADYVSDWHALRPSPSDELTRSPDRVDIEIVHLSYGRLRGKTSWTFWKLTDELLEVVKTWRDQAPEYFAPPISELLEAHRKHRRPFKLI